MTRQLVFIHGRSQQFKDPEALKRQWLQALNDGLEAQGLSLPPDTVVRFPYYANSLQGLLTGLSTDEVAPVMVKGPAEDAEEHRFVQEVLDEARREAGVSDADVVEAAGTEVIEKGALNLKWSQALLRAIDLKVPGGSARAIALTSRDVYHYLVAQSIRHLIDEGVSAALSRESENIVVAHSLGTVVAHNVLCQQGPSSSWAVPLLVTLGSPLGVSRIKQEIAPPRWPAGVASWFNALDVRDFVALYPLTPEHFPVGTQHLILNAMDVHNNTPNRHGITGYLSDPVVARTIWEAVNG